jgi:hypothetical protein
MPVTARLSRRFYDAIGDDAANDLVNWMNDVDATYRTDLLRLNEANLDRFSAEIARHAAELRGELDRRFADLRSEMHARFAEMDVRFAELRTEMDVRFGELRSEMDVRFAKVDARFATFESRMLRWMLVFWATTMAGLGATIVTVLQSR